MNRDIVVKEGEVRQKKPAWLPVKLPIGEGFKSNYDRAIFAAIF